METVDEILTATQDFTALPQRSHQFISSSLSSLGKHILQQAGKNMCVLY